MTYSLYLLIAYVVALVVSFKFTRVFLICFLLLPANVITWYLTYSLNSFWPMALWYITAVIMLPVYIWLANKIDYNFRGRVISVSLLINMLMPVKFSKESKRIIGRVLPYNKYQLKYNGSMITSSEIATAGSTLISGSTGSGKTYGMLSLIRQNIAQGDSVIFADYKGDPDIVKELEQYAKRYNYEVYTVHAGRSNFNYDPLINLNNSGRIEAIINMRKWSLDGADAHYRTSTQLLLQKTIQDFSRIFNAKMKGKGFSYTIEYYKYMKQYQALREEFDAYATVSKLLELLITSSLEGMFTFKNDKTLNFNSIKNKKFIVIVSFVSSNKELATSFSSLLFRDLLDECTSEPPNKNVYLYIDEFGTLENPFIIKDILEKGRSAKIATTLALQDINQIIIQTNEAYLNSILGTINTFIVYSGATRTTAEKFAGVQLSDIEGVLMNLRKPVNGKKPTAIYISKYPTLNKKTASEVFRFQPYIYDENFTLKNKEITQHETSKNQLELYDKDREEEFQALMEGRLTKEEIKKIESQKRNSQLNNDSFNVNNSVEIDNIDLYKNIDSNSKEEESFDIAKDFDDLIFGDRS